MKSRLFAKTGPQESVRLPLQRTLRQASFAPFLMLVVLIILFSTQIFRLIAMGKWVDTSDRIIAKIYENEKLLLDMETGVRAYFLTSDKTYLQPYNESRPMIQREMNELKSLLSSQLKQEGELKEIELQIQKLTTINEHLIQSTPAHSQKKPSDLSRIRIQKQSMDHLRDDFNSLLTETQGLRAIRIAKTNSIVLWTLSAGILVAFIVGSLLVIYLRAILMEITDQYQELIKTAEQAQAGLKEAQLQLENKIQKRTMELTLANQELEAFSYSVSHDLRAPLRGIAGFSQAILEDFEDSLDDSIKKYLNHIQANTKKMNQLIEDLLKLSQLSKIEIVRQEVNLSQTAKAISTQLQEQNPQRNVVFKIKDQLIILGDPGLLSIVVENLMSNAWKFTAKRSEALIEIGETESRGKHCFFIRDNGAGFNMNYVSQLFQPFQRLHPVKDFAGTGIGLATVQRIIRRHGGDIWAEGKENQGATFYVYL